MTNKISELKAVPTPGCYDDSSWQLIEKGKDRPIAAFLDKELAKELAKRWNYYNTSQSS